MPSARNPALTVTLLVTVSVITTALVMWMALETSYTMTETELAIRGGPVRLRMPLASICRMRRSHTLIAAPALSLRRLEIDYGTDGLVVISPANEAEFLAMLHERVPAAALPAAQESRS
jgi:Bacterial PH domain